MQHSRSPRRRLSTSCPPEDRPRENLHDNHSGSVSVAPFLVMSAPPTRRPVSGPLFDPCAPGWLAFLRGRGSGYAGESSPGLSPRGGGPRDRWQTCVSRLGHGILQKRHTISHCVSFKEREITDFPFAAFFQIHPFSP